MDLSRETLQIKTVLAVVRNEFVVDKLKDDEDKSSIFCHLFVIQFLEKLQQKNIETINGGVLLSYMETIFQIWGLNQLNLNKLKSQLETLETGEEKSRDGN